VYDIFGIALSSLKAAGTRLGASAHNVANIQTEEFRPHRVVSFDRKGGGVEARAFRQDRPDRVDLSREAVERSRAEVSFRAGLQVIRDEEKRTGDLIDLIA